MTDGELLDELSLLADRLGHKAIDIVGDITMLREPRCIGAVRDGYLARLRMAASDLDLLNRQLTDGLKRLTS